MRPSRYPLVLALSFSALLLSPLHAAVVFGPKQNARELNEAGEEMNGTAQQLFQLGQEAEARGDLRRAQKAYRSVVRRFPKDALAPDAAYRFAQLHERTGDYLKAAAAYRVVVEQYPRSTHFEEAIEAQFRIGEMYLAGKKVKLLGMIPVKASIDKAVTIFSGIVSSAPYGKYTARAQFNIGLAREKQSNAEAAVQAYQAVVEKFPDDRLAADAQYQIGYIWFKTARSGTYDAKAAANAKIGFQDFLFRYPKSEKAAQARENLRLLEQKQTTNAFQIARFYDKQKNYRAAVIYYNDVIRQQPGSAEGDRAKQRVDQLRAKVGDAALQPAALTAATAKKPGKRTAATESVDPRSESAAPPPSDSAPLPPPEADESLPPPASLNPGSTTAPEPEAAPTP